MNSVSLISWARSASAARFAAVMRTPAAFAVAVGALLGCGTNGNVAYVFGAPTNLGATVNSAFDDGESSVSSDGLSLFFASTRPGGAGGVDLWIATRPTSANSFGAPTNLGAVINSFFRDGDPSISTDGLSLYFASDRPGGPGNGDLWVATRATTADPFGVLVVLGATVNGASLDFQPSVSSDGLSLFFASTRAGGSGNVDLWVTTRTTTAAAFAAPVDLGPTVNSSFDDADPSISSDGLSLFFASNRPGGFGDGDLWVATRSTTAAAFGAPVNLGVLVNSSSLEVQPSISADGSTIFFTSSRDGGSGGLDLWQAALIPEPSAVTLWGLGVTALLARGWRRHDRCRR